MKILRPTLHLFLLTIFLTSLAFAQNTPETARNYYKKGVTSLGLKNYDLAIEFFTHSLDILPNYKEALLGRSRAMQGIPKYHRNALADIDKAIKIDASYGEAYFERAKIREIMYRDILQNPQPATETKAARVNKVILADLDSAINNKYETPEVYRKRAEFRCLVSKCKGAVSDYDKILEKFPVSDKTLEAKPETINEIILNRTIAKFKSDDLDGASADIEELARRQNANSDSPKLNLEPTLINLADSLNQKNESEFAMFIISKVLERNPSSGEAFYQRSRIRRSLFHQVMEKVKRMRHDEAMKYFQPILEDLDLAINFGYKTVESYESRASHRCRSMHMCKESIADYDAALLIKPDDRDLLMSRSIAKYRSDDLDGAISDLNEVINQQYRPNVKPAQTDKPVPINQKEVEKTKLAMAMINLGSYLAQKGESDFALEMYNRVVEFAPDNFFIYTARGQHKLIFGDLNEAIADFTKSIEISSKSNNRPLFQEYLDRGLAYHLLGNMALAQIDFDKAYEIMPRFKRNHQRQIDLITRKRAQKKLRVEMPERQTQK